MAINNILPLSVGTSSSNASFANNLGEIYEKVDYSGATPVSKLYRLVQNNSATTLSKNQVVVTGLTSSKPNYKVTTTVVAANPLRCGVVPAEFAGNTIADQAYFLLDISGYSTPNFAFTTMSNTSALVSLVTATTAGYCQPVFSTTTGVIYDAGAVFGVAINSTLVTAAGQPGFAILQGML
jgi:hypothetical protein